MEDLHLVFNGFFPFISLDFFKLANTLDPGGKHVGKNKKNENKAMRISVTCTIALTGSGCLSGWMNCGLFLITLHLEPWPAFFFNFWSFGPAGDCFVLCCHTIQNESCRSRHPRKKKSWKWEAMLKEFPETPSRIEWVCLSGPAYLTDLEDLGGGWRSVEGNNNLSFGC